MICEINSCNKIIEHGNLTPLQYNMQTFKGWIKGSIILVVCDECIKTDRFKDKKVGEVHVSY